MGMRFNFSLVLDEEGRMKVSQLHVYAVSLKHSNTGMAWTVI